MQNHFFLFLFLPTKHIGSLFCPPETTVLVPRRRRITNSTQRPPANQKAQQTPTIHKMEKFPDLPYEIRLAILEGLARSVRYSYSTSADRLSTLAVVCKEWHKVFEPEIFRQLILSPFRLQDLHQNIKNRKSLVKHIWYDVELQRYSCDDCDRRESPDRKLAVCICPLSCRLPAFANGQSRIMTQPPGKYSSSSTCCRTGVETEHVLRTG